MKKDFTRIAATFLIFPFFSQAQLLKTFHLNVPSPQNLLKSNLITDIVVKRDTILLGTDKGLSTTINGGLTWSNYTNTGTFDDKGISGIAVSDEILWVAIAFSTEQDGESLSSGGGLHFSTDRGQSWTYVAQPVDVGMVDTLIYGNNKIKALAITTVVNNITFDIALTQNTVWTANFAGMLRKSTDRGLTWQRVILPPDNRDSIKPSDSLDFDLAPTGGRIGLRGNLNHRVFSVYASDDTTIWVGTAGGINKSTDGGTSWQKFSHQNQTVGVSGNFVVAINEMRSTSRRTLWAATVNAEQADEIRGVSYTEDVGQSWKTALLGEFAHNIAFKDTIVYVASDGGLFRSSDFGSIWTRAGAIYDKSNLQRFTSSSIFAVASRGDTIWVGGPNGLAYTVDSPTQPFGSTWTIFRTYEPVGTQAKTYSYPSPFSPDDESVRIHYGIPSSSSVVTIRIFDFAMQPVRTLIQNVVRPGSREHDEIWNGKDDGGRRVSNGVYFYRIEIDSMDLLWGKILVIQ